jgi:hypothetical protein
VVHRFRRAPRICRPTVGCRRKHWRLPRRLDQADPDSSVESSAAICGPPQAAPTTGPGCSRMRAHRAVRRTCDACGTAGDGSPDDGLLRVV